MNRLNSYHFEVGGVRQAPGHLSKYRLVCGTVQELNMVEAYRKVSGDHASILCRGDTYCKIIDPQGKSVMLLSKIHGD